MSRRQGGNGVSKTENGNHEQDLVDEAVHDEDTDSAPEADEVSELEQALAERDDYLDQLRRSRAEFINYRKRSEQEKNRLGELFTSNTLAQFLPVLDDFDRAVAAVPEKDQTSGWVAGITMIHKKLQGILERANVEPIDAVNVPFDPAIHEAVSSEPGTKADTVVEVYQKGYKLGGNLLRAAMVKTGDAVEEAEGNEKSDGFDA